MAIGGSGTVSGGNTKKLRRSQGKPCAGSGSYLRRSRQLHLPGSVSTRSGRSSTKRRLENWMISYCTRGEQSESNPSAKIAGARLGVSARGHRDQCCRATSAQRLGDDGTGCGISFAFMAFAVVIARLPLTAATWPRIPDLGSSSACGRTAPARGLGTCH